MDLLELNGLTTDRDAQTTSIPVPKALAAALAEDPQQFGLPAGVSKRQALGLLVLKGARAGAYDKQEASMEETYRRLYDDPEWQAAAGEARAEAREDGLY
ncbi:MAG: hypothetical protein WKF42_05685 [Solirubrobacteraceae bacterium]